MADERDGAVIAHVVLSLEIGGAEMLVTRMVRSLRDRGFRPHVICLDAEGPLASPVREAGIPVTCLRRRPGILDLACARHLRHLLGENGTALVHTHEFEAYCYGSLAAGLGGRIPLVHTQHGLPTPFGWRQRWKVLALRRPGHQFVGVSDEVTALGLRSGWFVRDRTTTIANGIDVDAFRPDAAARRRTREALGIPDRDFVVITVARLAAVKDQVTLVRGFAASPASRAGHLLVVGDGPERARLEQEIDRLGMSTRIRLLGARSDVGDLLTAADVFALTSRSEGISVSLLEGMATGLVPVATAVGGNPHVVLPNGPTPNGLLVPAAGVTDLSEALRRLEADPDLRARLGAGARISIRDRFSHQVMMSRYMAVYERGLTDWGKAAADSHRMGL